MRTIAACLLFVLVGTTAFAQDVVPAKKILFIGHVKIVQGDPKGSVEAGTVTCLQELECITMDRRPFSLRSGGKLGFLNAAGMPQEVPFGRSLSGTPYLTGDGTFKLDLCFEITTAEFLDIGISQSTAKTQTVGKHRFGDCVKIQLGTGNNVTWAELVFEGRDCSADPPGPPPPPRVVPKFVDGEHS
jgi:hypothetical protein